jgi:hypothetical protein
MHLKLDDIELIKREDNSGVVKEIRSVHSLTVHSKRSIVELSIPGSEGNVFQDMGRSPSTVSFEGAIIGPQAADTAQSLKAKFEMKKALPFSSDMAIIGDITSVLIDRFSVSFLGGALLEIHYSIVLKEYTSTSASAKKSATAKTSQEEAPSQSEKSKKDVTQKIDKEFENINKKSDQSGTKEAKSVLG